MNDDELIIIDDSPPRPASIQRDQGSGSNVPWQTKARSTHTLSNLSINQTNNQSNIRSNVPSRSLFSNGSTVKSTISATQSNNQSLASIQSADKSINPAINKHISHAGTQSSHRSNVRQFEDSIEIVDDEDADDVDDHWEPELSRPSTYSSITSSSNNNSSVNNQSLNNSSVNAPTINPFKAKPLPSTSRYARPSTFTSSSVSKPASELDNLFNTLSSSQSTSSSSNPSSSLPASFNRPQMMSASIAAPLRKLPDAIAPKRKLPDALTQDDDTEESEYYFNPRLKRMVKRKAKSNSSSKSSSSSSSTSKSSAGKRIVRINCQLVGDGVMAISCTPSLSHLLGVIQGIDGAEYDDKLCMWTLPISAHNPVVARLAGFSDDTTEIRIHEIEEKFLHSALHGRRENDKRDSASTLECMKKLPKVLQKRLYPFQREGVSFAVEHEGRILLGDEMGLGKTLQSIAICAYYQSSWPVLIICPSSLRLNWKNEIQRWLPNVRPRNINVVLSGKDKLVSKGAYTTHFTIISYDLVARLEVQIKKQKYKFVIADESHYIKNAAAKRTETIVPVLKRADHCLLLSGTPALSRPAELFTQIDAITRGTVFGTMTDFGRRYCGAAKGRYGEEFKGATNVQELNFLMKQHCMIRRLKDDVLTELRPKTRTAAMIAIDDKELETQCRNMSSQIRSMASSLVQADEGSQGPSLSASARASTGDGNQGTLFDLYRRTGAAKLSGVIQYIGDLLEGGAKFLVFAHHLTVLDGIQAYLDKNKVDYFRLDGSTKAADRQAGVDRFQSTPDCRVALLSITAGGTGITLTASSIVVFAELTWNPALLMQAEDRVHRIGQPNAVNCHYLIGNHSLDEVLWPLLVKKMNVVSSVLDGAEDELEFGEVKGDDIAEKLKFKRDTGESHRAWEERERKKKAAEENSLMGDRDEAIMISDDDQDDFESVGQRETRSKTGALRKDGKLDNYFTKKPIARIRDHLLIDDEEEDEVVFKSEAYLDEDEGDSNDFEDDDLDGFLAPDDEEIEYYDDSRENDVLNDGSDDDGYRESKRSRRVIDETDEIEEFDEPPVQDARWRSRKRVRPVHADEDEAEYDYGASSPRRHDRQSPPTPTSASSLSSLPIDRNAVYGGMYNLDHRLHEWDMKQKQLDEVLAKPDDQFLTQPELIDMLGEMGFDEEHVTLELYGTRPRRFGGKINRYCVAEILDKLDQSNHKPKQAVKVDDVDDVDDDIIKIPCDVCCADVPFEEWKEHCQSQQCSQSISRSKPAICGVQTGYDDDDVDPVMLARRNRARPRRRIIASEDEEDEEESRNVKPSVIAPPVKRSRFFESQIDEIEESRPDDFEFLPD